MRLTSPLSALALGGLALALIAPTAASAADTYTVDPAHSFVLFRVKHMGVSNAYGRFNQFSGKFTHDGQELSGIAFQVTTQSIDTGIPKRDQHLRGPDFFNAAQFPTITFQSTSAKATGPGRYEVAGDLTLHGVTRQVVATVEQTGTGKNMQGAPLIGYEAVLEFKRSDFGMTNMIPGVGDEVRVTVSVEAAKS